MLDAALACSCDSTFFADPQSSIYDATDKPPNTLDCQYFVMLDGTLGRRVVLAVGYSSGSGYRYVGTRDIYNSEWLNDWRELAAAIPPQEYDLPLAEGMQASSRSVYSINQFGQVHIHGAVSAGDGTIAWDQVIGTLPEGVRPAAPIEACASFVVDGVNCAGAVSISADGLIKAYPNIESQQNVVYFDLFFLSVSSLN